MKLSGRAALAALLIGSVASACASSLPEPVSLETLAGTGPTVPADQVDALLARADFLYSARDAQSVRGAGEAWLQAARSDPARVEGFMGAAKAYVWLTDHESGPGARRDAAAKAVQAAQWCGRTRPQHPPCDYWLGAALGVQARERRSTGLDALPRIEEAFLRAAAAAPNLEQAGPDRALALLYLRAPGWPSGPGDPERGLEHARKAAGRFPEHPPNLLALAEALVAVEDEEGARETYRRALELAARRHADPEAAAWETEAREALSKLQGASGRLSPHGMAPGNPR
ncbi:MAG TPA: hypothetical protein VFP98_04465 [Candidatus Polarisedimenticolia bacterium]|nr:hypothetical protein [Candidatus Polarisedimenticolia bacterium]